ncbi:MAG TPA: ATP-binding cassette domain-containing protein [Methylomirabilota bacterium]|nr:ATP-binding cassette domain-containing protein [Methylomirabilota bacterium]
MEFAVETENLTKKYNDLLAVDQLNLQIKEGEIFGLLGPNGAGKTTTLSMLATLLKPTTGTARVNSYDILSQSSHVRQSIGIVFQDPSSDDILTGWENLYLHSLMFGVPKEERKKKIDYVLGLVDLRDRSGDIVKKYSGGMRRRLELARGLLHNPRILFLDEPTLGLDPQTREHIWEYIEGLVKTEKVTIIITTHYMEEADRLCNRIAIIDHGRVVALDSPSNLKSKLGGEVIKLQTRTPQLDQIKELDYVASINKTDKAVVLTVKNANAHLQEILSKIGPVESVEIRTPTLNDVFLHYTGREIREEAGEGGVMERIAHLRRGN